VLAADAEAFLAVRGTTPFRGGKTEEDILELVHTGVGKKQCFVTDGDDGRARDKFMIFASEEIYEACSYLVGC
jgi:hypothetical protein